jgi:hypothetical protein
MNLIHLVESDLVVNPLAIAYIDCNQHEGASDGGCELHLVTGKKLIITGQETNDILYESDTFNHGKIIAEEIELFRKSFMDSQK